MAERPRIIGIDLGTTNTCVASVRNKIPKVVPTDRGNLILPSVVALSGKGDLIVGGVAKDQMITNPKNTIYGSKRLVGRNYKSDIVDSMKNGGVQLVINTTDGLKSISDSRDIRRVALMDKIPYFTTAAASVAAVAAMKARGEGYGVRTLQG